MLTFLFWHLRIGTGTETFTLDLADFVAGSLKQTYSKN
jgi:hypothetical protein